MKRLLLGVLIGLFLGWLTVPFVKAAYTVSQSDQAATYSLTDDDLKESHAYKWYLTQLLMLMKQTNQHLQNIENNTQAIKDKIHA